MKRTRTVSLDADLPVAVARPTEPDVRVQRHEPDIENLREQVFQRTQAILEIEQPPYLYANPIAMITCDQPTPKFFVIVHKHQAEWCKRSRSIFTRSQTRRVKGWFTGEEQNKYQKFIIRGLCFTGLLFVQGKAVPSHEWQRLQTTETTSF